MLEFRSLDRRIHLIGRAILLLVLSGLTIGLTVVLLFVGELVHKNVPQMAAAAFIAAIGMLMTALPLALAPGAIQQKRPADRKSCPI